MHSLQLTSAGPGLVDFDVVCSKGTYIRSLAADVAASLGTLAHLVRLRREASGDIDLSRAWQLDDILAQFSELREANKADGRGASDGAV